MPARNGLAKKLPAMQKSRGPARTIQVESLFPPSPDNDSGGSAKSSGETNNSSAADLFDSLFSSSSLPSQSLSDEYSCPDVSPPSLVIRTVKSSSSEEVNEAKSKPTCSYSSTVVTHSETIVLKEAKVGQKRPSPNSTSSSAGNVYDFEANDSEKRAKVKDVIERRAGSQKFFNVIRSKVSYSHKWSDPEEMNDDLIEQTPNSVENASNSFKSCSGYMALRKVKQAHQCMESGELDDFKQELEYVISTLLNEDASPNLRYLSTIQLAKKCVSLEFRRFLKSQNVLDKIFRSLTDSSSSPALSLAIAVIIYFLARDQKNLPINDVTLRIISVLLKQEQRSPDAEYKKHVHEIWLIIKDWLNVCAEKTSKNIQFDLTEQTLSTSFLMLEALAYIAVRDHDQSFKQELLNSGCLQWVVAKFDKAVLTLSYTASNDSDAHIMLILKEIERCFRILENAAAFNKKNQAYLINHRNGLLIVTSAKFLHFFHSYVTQSSGINSSGQNALKTQLFDCICLMSRVLMNVSHENELCCSKLGQINGFLNNCISTLTNIAPKSVNKEKFFDICVMMYGLLVNVVERCNANRRKVLDLKTCLHDVDSNSSVELPVLEALAKLFVRHDTAARTIDEELDNDMFEEPDDEASNQEPSQPMDNGRLQRPVDLSEDEILNTVQSAMNKASAHMEDSMIASYLALLIGCLVDTDQKLADQVKKWLPNESLDVMIDQLQRFLDFMKITNLKSGATKSIERIIKSMHVASGAS